MYDHIVVGAGIVGSWTACILAEQGHKVLLVEQFPLPHTRGSSGGQSRIIRMAYVNPIETEMVKQSFPYWERLQELAGEELLISCQLLTVTEPSKIEEQKKKQKSIEKHSTNGYEWLTGEELRTRYPCCRFPLDFQGMLDLKAGVLRPDKSLKALQIWFRRLGGDIVDGFRVEHVTPGPPVTITGSRGTYKGKKLIVCAGPWSKKLMHDLGLNLPLVAQKTIVPYFRIKPGYRFPQFTYVYTGSDGNKVSEFYSTPPIDYPGMIKMMVTGRIGGKEVDPDHPEMSDLSDLLEKTKAHIRKHWPSLHDEPSVIERCMYTTTPDKKFILDSHPHHPHIAFSTGYAGTGFKIAPALGIALGDLVAGKTPEIDYSEFKMHRFSKTSKL